MFSLKNVHKTDVYNSNYIYWVLRLRDNYTPSVFMVELPTFNNTKEKTLSVL